MDELRFELTAISHFGTSLERPIETVERRGGRLIPITEESWVEYWRLQEVSRMLSTRALLLTAELLPTTDLIVPSPKSIDRITLNADGCWNLHVYDDQKNRARYGSLDVKGIEKGDAHRTMYRVFFGNESLPNGPDDFLDHHCENKACCYPRHLERVDLFENTRRGRVKNHDTEPFDFTLL